MSFDETHPTAQADTAQESVFVWEWGQRQPNESDVAGEKQKQDRQREDATGV